MGLRALGILMPLYTIAMKKRRPPLAAEAAQV